MANGVGSARVEIVGDVSKFARQVQDELNAALRRVQVDPVEVRGDFERLEREARDAAGDVERQFETAGEETERALGEVGDKGEREFDRLEREARDAGNGMSRALRGAAIGIGTAFAAVQIGQFLKDSVLAADELSDAIAISEQIITQTGGAAGLLADEIREISQNLSLEIGVDSAQVQSAANVLLTFKNVSSDTFDTALGLAADLSTVLGTDLNGATLQLGKALNDPVRGITALARAGVQFTESQKEQIKALVESGDLLGAQNIILGELEAQVGGTAAAAADSWAIVTNAFRETQRELGAALIPAIDALAPALISVAESLGPVFEAIGTTLGDALTALAPSLSIIGEALGEALGEIDLAPVGEAIGAVVAALAPLLPVLGRLLGALLPPLAAIIQQLAEGPLTVLAEAIADLLLEALTMLEPHLPLLVDLFGQIADAMAENLARTLPIVSQMILDLLVALLPLIPSLVSIVEAMLPFLTNVDASVIILQALAEIIEFAVIPFLVLLSELLQGDVVGALENTGGWFGIMRDIIFATVGAAREFIEDSVDRVRSVLNGIRGVIDRVVGFFDDLESGARDRFNGLVGFVRGIPGRIRDALGNLGSLLSGAGRQLIDGFVDSIRNAFGRVEDTLSDLTALLPDWKGPAEVDRQILRESGRLIIQGLQLGMDDERANVRRLLEGITGEIEARPAERMVRAEDGSMVPASFYGGGRGIRIDNLNMTVTDRALPMSEVFRNLEMIGAS